MYRFHSIYDFIWNTLILIFFVRDPCKKCLVRACCSERCEEKVYYLNFCDIEGKIGFLRFASASILFGWLTICLVLLNFVQKFFF